MKIMKGIIYYYSSTGNTKLVANYMMNHIKNAEIELCNIATEEVNSPEEYDIVGFASFAEYLGPPTLMKRFIESLNTVSGKPAFVLNTYAGFSGITQTEFAKQVEARGYKVVSGHSLITPMNYPPMRRNGRHSENAPSLKDMEKFNGYINEIDDNIMRMKNGEKIKSMFGPLSLKKLAPSMPREKVKKDFGIQQIDKDQCAKCGKCAKVCAYKAIEMEPYPEVDHSKCNGCWACYNQCPKQAIHAKSFKGEHQYKGPSQELINKLSK